MDALKLTLTEDITGIYLAMLFSNLSDGMTKAYMAHMIKSAQ